MNIKTLLCGLFAITAASTPAKAAVIAGPFMYGGHTYVQISTQIWTAAEAEAVSLGGHLATVNDAAENLWLYSTFSPTQGPWGNWIGYNDAASEGTFVWSSGETPGYTNWAPSEPNNLNNEDYAHIWWFNSTWNDLTNGSTHATTGIVELPNHHVPEGGSSLAMLGAAMIGLAGIHRKLKSA